VIKIAHISDIHFDKSSEYNFENYFLPALVKDFKESLGVPDIICITGDLLFQAGVSFKVGTADAFKIFETKFIQPLLSQTGLDASCIFFTPGNHDVARNDDEEFVENGLKSHLVTVDSVNEFIDKNTAVGMKRALPYKAFESSFYKSSPSERCITNFHSIYKITKGNHKIGISCLNSAWRCWDSTSDNGNLIVGEKQVVNSINAIGERDFTIALMHHPISNLTEFDRKSIEPILLREFNLILCGHSHEGSTWSLSNMYGNMFVSVAPSSWDANLRNDSRRYAVGYYMLDVNISKNSITTYARRYNHDKRKFDPNPDLGNDNGESLINLPNLHQKEQMQQEIEASSNILNFQINDMDEHLLSFSTETSAPKKIKDIFVMPTVTDKITIDSEEKKKSDEKIYSLEDLCSSKESILIFGQKEIGKTILLDRLVIESANEVSKFHKIPVFIDFGDIGNKRIETLVSQFLHVKITETPEYIKNNNILLLVDNLCFDVENVYQLARIEEFLINYPKVTIIGTILQNFEGQLPLELLNHDVFASYKFLTIKPYKTKEIKALVRLWFSDNDMFPATKLDKLLTVFGNLNLPRTPLAISMFLWIFEQQENYKPVNQATMLENFVEKMFQKQSKKEILSAKFDYRNKERLLTDIAYEMFCLKNHNYKMGYTQLLAFIEMKFKAKKFEYMYNPVDVLQHFLDKGVLSKEHDGHVEYVRFRFSCLFQYFMMKKMEFDPDFRDFVLSEDNYLYFDDEIDYYTGLKRDQTEILKTLVDRMNESFKEIIDKIDALEIGFDDMFNVEKSLSASLNDNFIEDLKSNPKPSEDDIDKAKDRQLENSPPEKEIKLKEQTLSPLERFGRIWALTAKVLKNSEEIEEEGLKGLAYNSILKTSMAYSSIYKYELEAFLDKNKDQLPFNLKEELTVKRNIVPWLLEVGLFMLMGTTKLNLIIKEKIESDIRNDSVSDYEKFISVFLYADLKGQDYMKHVKQFVKGIRRTYMLDMALFKVISYYLFRSKNKELDNTLENLIADIVMKSKNHSKDKKNTLKNNFRTKRTKHRQDTDPLLVY